MLLKPIAEVSILEVIFRADFLGKFGVESCFVVQCVQNFWSGTSGAEIWLFLGFSE